MIDALKKNVNTEIKILGEIANYMRRQEFEAEEERRLLQETIGALRKSMKIINNSIPSLVKEISLNRQFPSAGEILAGGRSKTELEEVKFRHAESQLNVVIDKKSREKLMKELSISSKLVKRYKRKERGDKDKYEEFKRARGYLKLANKFFLDSASRMVKKGYFKELALDLQKSNMDILFEVYVAMMLFTVLLVFIVSIFLTIFLIFFNIGFSAPFISIVTEGYLARIGMFIVLPIALPLIFGLIIYFYPSSEKKSVARKLDQELPFAVIHMSAVAGSGITPSEIFKIIGTSREYPMLRREIRKILNQINLYGYDLVTALNNASKTSPSEKLAELFMGLSTSITSGASLNEFFEKRAETLLVSYRMERERYTRLVETFIDIYISVLIAAPMIFLLLLVIISISGFQIGFTPVQLSLVTIFMVALLNILFLWFIQLRQPGY